MQICEVLVSLDLLCHLEKTSNLLIFHSAASFSVELDSSRILRIFTPLFQQIH